MTSPSSPFRVGPSGRTATASLDDHVRDLVEAVLFTAPGERVNRPDFGSGIHQLLFSPNSDEIAAAVQAQVSAALLHWLSDAVQVEAVEARADESTLRVLSLIHISEPTRLGMLSRMPSSA